MQLGIDTTTDALSHNDDYSLRTLPWDNGKYLRIVSATWTGDSVAIVFANGDRVVATPALLLPKSHANARWPELRLVDAAYLVVPTATGEMEVSASRIREVTSPAFARFLEAADRVSAWEIGHQLKALRIKAGLSGRDIAAKVGTTPQNISRVEKGGHNVGITVIKRILDALGATWQDLSNRTDEPQFFDFYRIAQFGDTPNDRLIAIETKVLQQQPCSLAEAEELAQSMAKLLRELPLADRRLMCIRLLSWIHMLLPGGPAESDKPEHIARIQQQVLSVRAHQGSKGSVVQQGARLATQAYLADLERFAGEIYRESF